jgi:hypothetical protein
MRLHFFKDDPTSTEYHDLLAEAIADEKRKVFDQNWNKAATPPGGCNMRIKATIFRTAGIDVLWRGCVRAAARSMRFVG